MANEVDPIIVEVGFKEDASIQDVITHLNTVKEKMEDVSKTEGSTGFLDQLGLSDAGRQEIITSLGTMITGLSGVGDTLSSIPTHLAQSFSILKNEITGIETLLNSVNGKQKSLANDSLKGMQNIQHMMMSVAGMSAQSQNIQDFSKSFGGATKTALGWSAGDMAKYAPSVVSMVLEPAVRKIMAENKHGIGFNGIVSSIMRDNNNVAFLRNLAKNEGIEDMSREQIQANYEMMLRGWTPYAMSTGSAGKLLDWKARGLYQTKAQALRVEDRFAKDAQDYQKLIFSGYGKNPYVEQQAAEYIRSQGGSPVRSYTQRKQSGLQGLHKFLREGNNMDELFPLLKEAGIATVNNKGQYQIYSNIREQQLQYLRARALQEYSNALRSDAPYEGNPTDVLFAGKMTGRQGRRPSLYLGLNNALPEEVIPSLAGFDAKTMGGYGGKINTGVSVGKTPTLSRYYIPQTTIDFNKGAAVVRSNFWQKDLSKGIDARPDDEQAAITDSLIARMFGMKGDRTLGFGHDEKTGAIRRTTKIVGADGKERTYELTPNMFTADFSKFIKYNDEAGRYEVDKTHPDYARAERILSGKELVDYGINPETGKAEKYRFLYSKDDGRAIFGKESIAQEIEKRYAERHLPSPFKYGNDREAGIFFEGDNTKTIKQINAMAKMASSGTPIEELMSESQAERLRNATGIYANFEMMYDILDQMEKDSGGKYTGKWTKTMGRRMDGLAFGDPTIFGRDFQGRFASGTDKFAMGAYDWRPMLLKGWEAGRKLNPRLYGYDTDVTGMSDEEKMKHRAIFAPTGGASKEDRAAIEAYIKGETYKDPTTGRVLSEDELRKQYFTNVVASDAGYLIDRTASKSGLGYRTLSVENFWNGKEGLFSKKDYDEAVAEGRVKNGEVRLLPWQQEKYRREYAAAAMPGYSGFIEMKNEGDMLSGKSFIPESVLRGVNAPTDVFEKSERLYRRSLEELNTTAGRIKQFQGDANAMEAIAEDPSWVWNNHTAITHIEQTRRALEARRARNEVMLDDGRDENGNPISGRQGTIAVGTVGQLAEIFQAMTGMSNKDYGEFQSLLPSVMEGNNAVFSKGVSTSVIDMLTRFPFASGQYMMDVNNYAQATEVDDYLNSLDALSKTKSRLGRLRRRNTKNFSTQRADRIAELEKDEAELQQKVAGYQDRINNGADAGNEALKMAEALRKSGRDPRTITSMMMTAGQIYSMNTGDFDGDTVNAFIGMSEAFKHNARVELDKVRPEIQKQREAELRKVELEAPEQSPLLSKGEGVMQAWAQASTATQKMAVASAALRKAQTGDPNDPSRVIALAEAMQAYDLATSDVKTKNADFKLGSYAEKYLYSQGAHYERFIKQLQDNSADGSSTGREGLFKFSAASTLDPEGIFALSARHSNARMEGKGGIFDLDSYEKMENWYRKEFGAENTEESRAARFYLDRMEDNIIWGKLWSQKDIDEGNKRIAAWGSKLDARRQAGQNVDEEYARYEDFRKRMAEMVDEKGVAGTEENVRKLAERYERMAQDETDQTKSKGYALYAENLRRMLPESEDENERKAREAFIETKKHSDYTWAKEVRTLEEASRDQQNLDSIVQNTRIGNIVAAAKGESGRSIYNWSNAKHFIGADQLDGKLYLDGIQKVDLSTGEKKNLPAQTVDYYKNADALNRHMKDMILDASGEKDRTEAWQNPMTHIGQLMHSTFERVKTPSERSVYGSDQEAETASIQWMRDALLGKPDRDTRDHDMAALRSLGLGFIETENGSLKAINVGNKHRWSSDELAGYTATVNNLLGSGGSKGFMQQQLDVLREAEKQGEEVLSIEDKLYRGGKEVSDDFGGRFYRRVVTDKEGNVVSSETSLDKDFQYQLKEGEKEHIYETHAKPDYVTRMKDADENGVHGLHIYDWKSSANGALESIPQSMFYANMFAELGKKFYDTGDQRYEQFKEWYDQNTGRSTVKMITGVNPRQGGENYNFDATTDAGRKQIADIARKVDIGMLTEEKLGLAGFEAAWPYLSRIADKKEVTDQEIKSARQMLDNNEFNASSAEMDFFLSTYGQNKERLGQLRSDIYREHNKNYMNPEEYVPQDRFSQRERELKEMFSQQMLAAVIANAGDSEAINKEVQDIQDTRAKLMAMNEQDALNAVTGDLDQSRTTIRQMLRGIKPSSESNVVFGAVGALRRAAQTKEYLKADEKYYDKTSGFKVNDENQEIAEVAKKRKEAYEEAIEQEKSVNEYLTENLVGYTARYDKQQASKIDSLTRTKPLDPTESFNKFVENKQEELQKLIDQYNENVKAYDEQINKTTDARVKSSLERLRDIDKGNAERLQEFIDSGGTTEQAIQERRKQLGLDKETPDEQADRWLQERTAVVKTERSKRFSDLMDLEASDQSTLAERQKAEEEYQKTIEEQKKLEAQAESMKERGNRIRREQLDDTKNTLAGTQLSPAQQAERRVNAFRDQITQRRDSLGLNDPLRAQYDKILNDKAAWDNMQARMQKEAEDAQLLKQQQQDTRYDQLMRQGYALNRTNIMGNRFIINRALSARDSKISSWENYRSNIQGQIAEKEKWLSANKDKMGTQEYSKTADQLKELQNASTQAGNAIQNLSGPMGTAGAVASTFAESISRVVTRLGRRLFMKAIAEAKKFVREFDAAMTSIQMITLKSDNQMSALGDGLISKAKELKISISDITKSAETLYRQGLSDEEVSERLDVISKFSKVSGTKVDAATKLVTVAMNTGLVTDSQVAADIVTALGDNAATNATEIEKGIEKAGAAAAADGTTFAQLASMLTAITSTTQIGGNVAGRTLNTIFGRMNKIGTNELIYDENGHAISGSAVAKILQAQGIRTYDEQGNKRSSYDVLYELSKRWDTISDAEQQQLATAIAGTRQYSNFAAIMQGMSEGKVDEYMNLAADSAGITDKKYQIYLQSLQASLTDLKNTFDNLVNDLTKSGIAEKVIKGLTNIINGIDNLVNSEGGLTKIVGLMITMAIAMAAIKSGNIYAMLAGAAFAGISLASLNSMGSQEQKKSDYESWTDKNEKIDTKVAKRADRISELKELKNKGVNRTEEEDKQYKGLLQSIFTENKFSALDDASSSVDNLTSSAEALTKALQGTSEETDNYAQQILDEEKKKQDENYVKTVYSKVAGAGAAIKAKYEANVGESLDYSQGRLPDEYSWLVSEGDSAEYAKWLRNRTENELSSSASSESSKEKWRGLSEALAAASEAGAFSDDEYNKLSADEWYGRITSRWNPTRNAALSDQNIADFRQWEQTYVVRTQDSSDELYSELLFETFRQIYSDILGEDYAPEEIDALARANVDQFDYDTFGGSNRSPATWDNEEIALAQKYVEDTLGFSENNGVFDKQVFDNAIKKAKEKGGYDEAAHARKKRLELLGIRNGEEGDYYIGEDDKIYTYEEITAEDARLADLRRRQDLKYVSYGSDGQVVKVKEGTEFTSDEEAQKYLKSEEENPNKAWYFLDNEGNRHYFNAEGKPLSEDEARQLQADYEAAGQANVQRSYYNSNTGETKTYEGKDVGEAADAFVEQWEEDVSKAFQIRRKGTSTQFEGTTTYGSAQEAVDEVARLNAIEAEAYQTRVTEAQANWRSAIIDQYGEEAGSLIYEQLTGQNPEATIITDRQGNFVKSFATKAEADQFVQDNYQYYRQGTGEYLGQGAEGYEAATRTKKKYYLDGTYLGEDEEGLEEYNRISETGGAYRYTTSTGEIRYTTDEGIAKAGTSYARQKQEDALQNAYEERLAELLYDTSTGYIESGGTYGNQLGVIDVDNGTQWPDRYVVEEYTDESGKVRYKASHLKGGIWSYQEGDMDQQGRISSLVEQAGSDVGYLNTPEYEYVSSDKLHAYDSFGGYTVDTEYSRKSLQAYVDSIKEAIPSLEDVDPQIVLEVWGQLPEAIKENIRTTGEVGEEVLKIVQEATNTVLAAQPKYKAIKNHFMKGASTAYQSWETTNEYSVVSDKMLRMIQQHPEINDLQSLVKYVNENDIAQWSTLNTNADFARLTAPIQLDHGIIQNSQEQQDEIYQAIIEWLYAKGRDYGALKLSSSQKAAYAQSAYNKMFYPTQEWEEQRAAAWSAEAERLGLDSRATEYGRKQAEFYASYEKAHAKPVYFDSEEAAYQTASEKASVDAKAWQEAYNAEYAKTFYAKRELTQEELNNGWYHDTEGYVVNASGERQYATGYDNEDTRNAVEKEFDQTYKKLHPALDETARRDEYLKGYQWITDTEKDYLKEVVGEDLYQRLWGTAGGATNQEKAYATMLIENRRNGITELTEQQKADLASQTYKDLLAGKTSAYTAMDDTTRAAHMVGINGMSDLYQMAVALEENGMTFAAAVNGEYTDEQLNKAFNGRYTAEDLRAKGLTTQQALKLNEYRNNANYSQISSLYSGVTNRLESERIKTYQTATSSQSKIKRARSALDALDTNKTFEELDTAVVDELVSATGYTKDQIKTMWKAGSTSAKTTLKASIDAQSSELNDALISTFNILSEGLDFSSLGEDVDTETLASYFDETNAALANYIRTIGISVKNGKTVIEEGTEALYTTLQEAQTEEDAAVITKKNARDLAYKVAFGTKSGSDKFYGKTLQQRAQMLVTDNTQDLSSIDGNLRYMLTLAAQPGSDITAEELQAAYNAAYYGGATTTKYGYSARKLFGEGGFTGRTWSVEELAGMRERYKAEAPESPLVQLWDEMFSEMGDSGTALKEYLNGTTENLPENFLSTYTEWFNGEALKGLKDAITIAQNRATLSSGNAAEQLALTSTFSTDMRNARNAQYALENPLRTESASTLATYLGIDEKEVSSMIKTSEGRTDLQKALEDKTKELYKKMAMSYGADLGSFDVSSGTMSEMKSLLQAAADSATGDAKEFLQNLVNSITDAGHILSEGSTDVSDVYDQAITSLEATTDEIKGYKFLKENAAAAVNKVNANQEYVLPNGYSVNEQGVVIDQYGNASAEYTLERQNFVPMNIGQALEDLGMNPDQMKAISGNNGVIAALERLRKGDISQDQFNTFLDAQISGAGKNFDYYEMLAGSLGSNYQNGEFNAEGLRETLDAMQIDPNLKGVYDELIDKYPQLEEAANGSSLALKNLNEQWKSDKVGDISKYAKGISNIAEIMTGLAKGGTDATKAEIKLNAQMAELSDQQTAISQARGKSGAQLKKMKNKGDQTLDILAGLIPEYDAEQLANMSQQQLDELFNQVQPIIGKQFADTVESLWSMLPETVINLPIGDLIHVNADGQLELSEFAAQLDPEVQRVLNVIMSLLGTWATVDVRAMLADGSINVEALLAGIRSSGIKTGGGYSRGNNKSGSSGKTKIDALIEGQSHYIKRRQHFVKMAQIGEEHFERMNDYQSQVDYVGKELNAQEALLAQYRANNAELEKMGANLKVGSEDWYKWKEAMDANYESIAETINAIDALNDKLVAITERKQQNEDKPLVQANTMLGLKAQGYLDNNQFKNYEAITLKQIDLYRTDLAQNQSQLAEWQNLISKYDEGTKEWMDVRDKIWGLKAENAELENKILEETNKLNESRISQIATDLQNYLKPFEHEQSMISTYAGMYQSAEQYGSYRNVMTQTNAYYTSEIDKYNEYIKVLEEEIKKLDEGSTAWFNARDAIFQYEEAVASATAAIRENNAAIQESYISEINSNYDVGINTTTHELNMAKIAGERYDKNNDFANYYQMLQVQQELTGENIDATRAKLTKLEDLLHSGKITDPTQWKTLTSQIMQLREQISQAESSYEEFNRLMQQSELEHIVERFKNDDSIIQHRIKMIQYEETRYQNKGELTNQNTMLSYENAEQEKRKALIESQIELLKEQLKTAEPGSAIYKQIVTEILSMEEQLESTDNIIDQNNEKIKKNIEQMHKLQSTVENTINSEIKARKQLEREMLAGTVDIQKQIYEVIKKNYSDEWNLLKKDLDKKKEALNTEKGLINERLRARKEAIDAEDKYEHLAELQKQLAIVAADPTRSKDAKELRKQIADLQKEISWDVAEKEAANATQAIEDQVQAIDEYISIHEEDLNEMLRDMNNFAEQLNQIMAGSFEEYVQWMKENDENYKYASDEVRKQMEQGWQDTWDKMTGYVRTYWDEVDETMRTKEGFIEYMKQSQKYMSASENEQWILLRQYEQMYDDYVAALKDDATWDHTDDYDLNYENPLDEYDYTTGLEDTRESDIDDYDSELQHQTTLQDVLTADAKFYAAFDEFSNVTGNYYATTEEHLQNIEEYTKAIGEKETEVNVEMPEIVINTGSSNSSGGSYGNNDPETDNITQEEKPAKETRWKAELDYMNSTYNRHTASAYGQALTESEAKEKAEEAVRKYIKDIKGNHGTVGDVTFTKIFKKGGLVDFTGPAWVDGTKSRPEAFLSAYDTEQIANLTKALQYIRIEPGVMPSSDLFNSNNTTVGDINITINQAELKSDTDIEDLARKVGKSFTKQLSKQGFNISGYAF